MELKLKFTAAQMALLTTKIDDQVRGFAMSQPSLDSNFAKRDGLGNPSTIAVCTRASARIRLKKQVAIVDEKLSDNIVESVSILSPDPGPDTTSADMMQLVVGKFINSNSNLKNLTSIIQILHKPLLLHNQLLQEVCFQQKWSSKSSSNYGDTRIL